jgi:hypothetical protein
VSKTIVRALLIVAGMGVGILVVALINSCSGDPYFQTQAACLGQPTRAMYEVCAANARLAFADATALINSAALPHDAGGMAERRGQAAASAAATLDATGGPTDAEAKLLADMKASAQRVLILSCPNGVGRVVLDGAVACGAVK